MARPLRLEFPGAVHHVMSRGNHRLPIYKDDYDRRVFKQLIGTVVDRYGWLCHGYCLMNNHYHLAIETPDANLSKGMRHLNGVYSQTFNRRHGESGHVFQGRFKSVLVQRDQHLLSIIRYIELNPVRAGLVSEPAAWRWSSYRALAGLEPAEVWLTTSWVLEQFHESLDLAREVFAAFVCDGLNTADKVAAVRPTRVPCVAGTPEYERKIGKAVAPGPYDRSQEIPRESRLVGRPLLEELFGRREMLSRAARNRRIAEAHLRHCYTMVEIGRHLGIHYSTVSRAVRQVEMTEFKT